MICSYHYELKLFSSEFEVDSIHFPGQVHKWRLSELLQKGTVRSQDTLLRVSQITRLPVIYSHLTDLNTLLRVSQITCLPNSYIPILLISRHSPESKSGYSFT